MNGRFSIIMFLFCISLISCKNKSDKQLIYSFNEDGIISEICSSIFFIVRSEFAKAFSIHMILPAVNDSTEISQIMGKVAQTLGRAWPIVINNSFSCDSYEPKLYLPKPITVEPLPDIYIMALNEQIGVSCLDAQIKRLREEESFNPRAIFLLILLTNKCGVLEYDTLTAPYVDKLWKNNCFALIILVFTQCDFNITFLTAIPFSNKNTCRQVQANGTEQFNLSAYEGDIGFSYYKSNHKNFNKCSFIVGTVPSPPYVVGKPEKNGKDIWFEFVGGIDIELLLLISTIYNFTYVFDTSHGFESEAMFKALPNGSASGVFIDLLRLSTDIAVGGIIPHPINYFRFEYSRCYTFSTFDWFVGDASDIPQWKLFFGVFSLGVWILSVIVFLFASFLYSFMEQSSLLDKRCNCFLRTMFYSCFKPIPWIKYFGITLGLPSTLKPKLNCLRVLYYFWNIYSLHWCIAYSSVLFLLMSNTPLGKEIATVEDLKESGLKTGSKAISFQRFMFVRFDDTTMSIMNNSFVCPSLDSCIVDFVKHKNFSLLIKLDELEFFVNLKQTKIHRIAEPLLSFGVSVMTSKGNPLYLGINKLIPVIFESGLIEKWNRDIKSNFKKVKIENSSKNDIPLNLNDLKGVFVCLIGGLAVSIFVFFAELLVCFLKK